MTMPTLTTPPTNSEGQRVGVAHETVTSQNLAE